jgi:hypothetical protein
MIRNEKCKVLDKQNFEPKYRRVYDNCYKERESIWCHLKGLNEGFKASIKVQGKERIFVFK